MMRMMRSRPSSRRLRRGLHYNASSYEEMGYVTEDAFSHDETGYETEDASSHDEMGRETEDAFWPEDVF